MDLRNVLLSSFVLVALSAPAQRYLTPIFDAVDVVQDIQYGAAMNYLNENEALLLDFYSPIDDPLESRPLIIYCHGGGFIDQNQHKALVHIVAYADSMARRGYTVASIDYRLDTAISNRAVINAMHDAKAAVRFFKSNASAYGIDTSLVFIGGESAGAVTALTTNYINLPSETSYPPSLPQADVTTLEGESGNPGFGSRTKATLCFCGGTSTVTNELLFDTTAIAAGDPSLLIVHGTDDSFIPVLRSLELAIRANNVGVPSLFYPMEGANHCPWFFPLEDSWAYLDTLIDISVPFLYACIQSTTSVDEFGEQSSSFSIAPNPSSGLISIKDLSGTESIIEIVVMDTAGSIRLRTIAEFNNAQLNLDLSHLAKGLYHIRIDSEGSTGRTMSVVLH